MSTTGWFVKLHPEVHIDTYYKFFYNKVKLRVVKLKFALVVKFIFNGEKQQPYFSYSFIKKNEKCSKTVYIEVCKSQALELTLAIRVIIKSEEFY